MHLAAARKLKKKLILLDEKLNQLNQSIEIKLNRAKLKMTKTN